MGGGSLDPSCHGEAPEDVEMLRWLAELLNRRTGGGGARLQRTVQLGAWQGEAMETAGHAGLGLLVL
jgi:hypothetical protein